jgi:hypothetical protein
MAGKEIMLAIPWILFFFIQGIYTTNLLALKSIKFSLDMHNKKPYFYMPKIKSISKLHKSPKHVQN